VDLRATGRGRRVDLRATRARAPRGPARYGSAGAASTCALRERGRFLNPHAGDPVQADRFDQRLDLRLRANQQHRPAVVAQPPRDHREVEHQRGVSERQLAQIDDYVRLGVDRTRQGLSPRPLRAPVLVAAAAKCRRLVIEVDDFGKLSKDDVGSQDLRPGSGHFFNLDSGIGRDRGAKWAQIDAIVCMDRRLRAHKSAVPIRARHAPTPRGAPADPRKLVLMATIDDVREALRDVIDPELGLDFVELGLIYDIEVENGTVRVTYTLTSPGCPIGPQVSEQIEEFVGELDGVVEVHPTMTFSPAWTPELMSEDAKFALGF
jgi:metal-sulfur cluster biosynthetic enzyme